VKKKIVGNKIVQLGIELIFVERTVPIQNICAEVELAAQINLNFIG
jgi:hypothetical protein